MAGLGRLARSSASACAAVARSRPARPALRASSRLTVDGLRPNRPAIARIDSPPARPTAISSRSANVKQRPFRSRPRRGRIPLSAISHRVPFSRYVPASAAATVTNSPRAIATQNTCPTSGTIRSENRAITPPFTRHPIKGPSRAPAPGRTARRSPRSARPRARLRDDRRATQPRSSDDQESPSNWAGVAITARTQGTSCVQAPGRPVAELGRCRSPGPGAGELRAVAAVVSPDSGDVPDLVPEDHWGGTPR